MIADKKRDARPFERTIDNLKRLFAIVFSVSYGLSIAFLLDRAQPFLTDPRKFEEVSWVDVIVTLEVYLVFIITAGVFYHHGARFLDNRYGSADAHRVRPSDFVWDFGLLFVQMIPFLTMAFALSPEVTQTHGYTWFFFAYVLAFLLGLILLVLAAVKDRVRSNLPSRIQNEISVLRLYWMAMNATVMLTILAAFYAFERYGQRCPANHQLGDSAGLFISTFALIAILRDWFDLRGTWEFHFPYADDRSDVKSYRIVDQIRWSGPYGPSHGWMVFAISLVIACFAVAYVLQWWNIPYWATVCLSSTS